MHKVHVLLTFGTNDTTVMSHMNYDAITVGHTLLQKVIPSKLVQLFFSNNKGTMLSQCKAKWGLGTSGLHAVVQFL